MSLRQSAPCFSHPLFLGSYIEDIVECLYVKEVTRINFSYTSPQIDYRELLVDFMKNFAEHRGFRRTSLHLGVYILDVFMDNHKIALERLNIVSLVCLMLGAKIEEMEYRIPKLSEIKQLTNVDCNREDYIALEKMILEFLEWNIVQPTACTFIELYLDAIISNDDFSMYNTHVTDRSAFTDLISMKSTAATIIFEYLNLTLSNIQLSQELPSKLAAAIVAATRYTLTLDPIWPPNLFCITGYQLNHLETLVSILFQLKNSENDTQVKDKRKSTPDSGYISTEETDTEEDSDPSKRFKT